MEALDQMMLHKGCQQQREQDCDQGSEEVRRINTPHPSLQEMHDGLGLAERPRGGVCDAVAGDDKEHGDAEMPAGAEGIERRGDTGQPDVQQTVRRGACVPRRSAPIQW